MLDITQLDALRVNPEWRSLPLFDRTGWSRVRFGDVVRNVNETVDPAGAGIERFIGLEHLEPGSLQVRSWGNVAEGTTFTRRCRPGQVLFGKRRAYQRKVAVAEFDAVVSGDIYVLGAQSDRLLPELLPYVCLSERFFHHAVGTSAGSLSPRTNWSSLAEFEFDLPPLGQQHRISAVLRAIEGGLSSTLDVNANVEATVRAHLCDWFRDSRHPVTPVCRTGTVQLGRQRAPKYQSGKFLRPYLRVANVFDGVIDYSDVLKMDFDSRDFENFRLEPGDILLNEGQSRELVGRCAMYDGKLEGCCFQNTLVRYKPGKDVDGRYAFAYFQYCFQFGVFASIARQTTSIAHLGADRFGALLMPLPPKRVQQDVAAKYEELRALMDKANGRSARIADLRRQMLSAEFP